MDSIFNKYLYRVGDHKSTISAIFGVTLKLQGSFEPYGVVYKSFMGAGTCYLPVLNWAKATCRGYLAKNWPVSSRYQFSYGCSRNAAKGIVTGL